MIGFGKPYYAEDKSIQFPGKGWFVSIIVLTLWGFVDIVSEVVKWIA